MRTLLKIGVVMVILVLSQKIFSQDCLFLDFPKKNPIKSSEINFSIRKLIDARENPDSLGCYYEKQGAMSKTVVCMESFALGFKRHLDAHYPKKDDQLILVIEDLDISNSSNNPKEIAAGMRLIYCISAHDSLKTIWQHDVKSSYSSKGKPKDVLLVLFTAIDESFKEVPAIDWDKTYPDYVLPSDNEDVYPALFSCDSLNTGVFTTRNALLHNQPSNMHLFRVKFSGKNKYLMYKETARMVDKRGYVAYSDGEKIFINTRSYRSSFKKYATPHSLIEMHGRGKYFVWVDDILDNSEAVAGALFGVVGAMASSHYNVFVWDTTTGEIFELDPIRLNRIIGDYPQVMEQYNTTPDHNNTLVWIDMIIRYDELWLKDKGLKGVPLK